MERKPGVGWGPIGNGCGAPKRRLGFECSAFRQVCNMDGLGMWQAHLVRNETYSSETWEFNSPAIRQVCKDVSKGSVGECFKPSVLKTEVPPKNGHRELESRRFLQCKCGSVATAAVRKTATQSGEHPRSDSWRLHQSLIEWSVTG